MSQPCETGSPQAPIQALEALCVDHRIYQGFNGLELGRLRLSGSEIQALGFKGFKGLRDFRGFGGFWGFRGFRALGLRASLSRAYKKPGA